jgi:hypothetical protein
MYIDRSGWTQDRADASLEKFYFDLYCDQIDLAWELVKSECENNADPKGFGSCYIGTVFDIMPSGKFWTFWARSNVDRVEAIKDTAYNTALAALAELHGGFVENGEDDPCDLFVVCEIGE